jgi:hypothetical protein
LTPVPSAPPEGTGLVKATAPEGSQTPPICIRMSLSVGGMLMTAVDTTRPTMSMTTVIVGIEPPVSTGRAVCVNVMMV